MPDPLGDHDILQQLTAFADGELDAAQNLEVLRYIAAHPEALELMDQEQRLRLTARRVIRARTPAASPALRAKIEALATSPSDSLMFEEKRRRTTHRWWLAAVACLMLLVGGIGGRFARPQNEPVAAVVPPTTQPVTVSPAHAVIRVHVDCSRFARLHKADFPEEQRELAEAVRADLGARTTQPDLSAAGYKLIGAGPCRHPLENTVHLLYRATAEDVSDTLSLFVQPYTGQVQIDGGKTHLLAEQDVAHPAHVWRSDRVVYSLVGDETEVVNQALALMEKRRP